MAEKLAFQKLPRHPGAINSPKRLVRPGPLGVERLGHQLLPHSALSDNQNGPLRRGHLAKLLEKLPHRPRTSNHAMEVVRARPLAHLANLPPESPGLETPLNSDHKVIEVERLGDEIVGPGLEGFYGLRNGPKRRNYNERRWQRHRSGFAEKIYAAPSRQAEVAHNKIGYLLLET